MNQLLRIGTQYSHKVCNMTDMIGGRKFLRGNTNGLGHKILKTDYSNIFFCPSSMVQSSTFRFGFSSSSVIISIGVYCSNFGFRFNDK